MCETNLANVSRSSFANQTRWAASIAIIKTSVQKGRSSLTSMKMAERRSISLSRVPCLSCRSPPTTFSETPKLSMETATCRTCNLHASEHPFATVAMTATSSADSQHATQSHAVQYSSCLPCYTTRTTRALALDLRLLGTFSKLLFPLSTGVTHGLDYGFCFGCHCHLVALGPWPFCPSFSVTCLPGLAEMRHVFLANSSFFSEEFYIWFLCSFFISYTTFHMMCRMTSGLS